MHRRIPLALVLGALVAIIAYPSIAGAVTLHVTQHQIRHPVVGHTATGPLRTAEPVTVERVVRIAPVDSDQDGFADTADGCPSTPSSVNGGCPEAPAPTTAAASSASVASSAPPASVATASATSSGGCPSYMSGEATSPTAQNPSGAYGCYQVMPDTAAAMGSACADVNATSCVAAICAAQGNDAWRASGATPCDYIRP